MAEVDNLKGMFPWTRRPDKMLKRLTLREFFTGVKDRKGIPVEEYHWVPVAVRLVVLLFLLVLAGVAAWSLYVVLHNTTALEHRCERLFTLWPLACGNCAFYFFALVSYFSIWNQNYFRSAVLLSIILLVVLVAWWLFVWTNIAPICVTFYHMQYPYLLHLFHICGTVDSVMLVILLGNECCLIGPKPDGYEDPIMFTSVFYKADDTWVPPLFRAPQVTLYKEGVQKWTEGTYKRVGQLQASLDKAERIKKNSENQSLLLRQVTELVVETEAKVTKVETLMDDQEQLIGDFKVSFQQTKDIMDGLADAPNSGFSMCTGTDVFLWLVMVVLCCVSFICIQLAVSKWASMFGFSDTPVVLEYAP